MEYFNDAWVITVLQIIAIDIVLGGDNAIVIALACRNLPKHQRRAARTQRRKDVLGWRRCGTCLPLRH